MAFAVVKHAIRLSYNHSRPPLSHVPTRLTQTHDDSSGFRTNFFLSFWHLVALVGPCTFKPRGTCPRQFTDHTMCLALECWESEHNLLIVWYRLKGSQSETQSTRSLLPPCPSRPEVSLSYLHLYFVLQSFFTNWSINTKVPDWVVVQNGGTGAIDSTRSP